jgi:hypothetical protein
VTKGAALSDELNSLRRYDALAARVYEERRMPAGTRDLVLALGWVTLRDPRRHDPAVPMWQRTGEVLNADNRRLWQLIADDAPRYAPDWEAGPHGCRAPMARAGRPCGKPTTIGFAEFDPASGWMTSWAFCSRPRCRAYMQPIRERAHGSKARAPEAVPNRGGLLPVFLSWDWEAKYRRAAQIVPGITGWTPPSYGLSAETWPAVPGQEPPKAFPRLRLVASGGELVASTGSLPVPRA